jgi:tetratricopeptide (TPR) repeat protein
MKSFSKNFSLILISLMPLSLQVWAQSVSKVRKELLELAEAAYQDGRSEDCIAYTTRLIQEEPGRAELYELRGRAREQKKDYKGAITELSIACELEPENPGFRFARGLLAYQNGRTDLARSDFRTLLRKKPSVTNTVYFRINSNQGVDQVVTLESDLKAQLLHYLGLNEIKAGDYSRAVELLDSAIALAPKDPDLFAHRALALNRSGAPELAHADLEIAFGLSDSHAHSYASQSRILLEQGDPAGAAIAIDQAIKRNNKVADFYAERGALHAAQKNFRAAYQDYDSAILLNPNDPELWFNRGIMNEKINKPELALQDYRKAIRLDETYKQAWFMAGNVLLKQNKFPEAIEDFGIALTLAPDYVACLHNRAIAFYKSGNKVDACQDWAVADQLKFEPSAAMLRKHCKN